MVVLSSKQDLCDVILLENTDSFVFAYSYKCEQENDMIPQMLCARRFVFAIYVRMSECSYSSLRV